MINDNKKMVKKALDEIWNKGKYEFVEELFARDHLGHTFKEIEGREGVKNLFTELRTAFPDLKFMIEDQFAEDDKVVTRWTCRGTHKGEFQGVPPTENIVEISGITIFRLADGKIVEGWTNVDMMGLMQQLGTVPVMEQIG